MTKGQKRTAVIVGVLLLLGGGLYLMRRKKEDDLLGGLPTDVDDDNDDVVNENITEDINAEDMDEVPTVKLGDPIRETKSPSPTPTKNSSISPKEIEAKIKQKELEASLLKEEYARKLSSNTNTTASRSVTTEKKGCYKSNLGEECCYQPNGDVRCESIANERLKSESLNAPMRRFIDFDGDIESAILDVD